MKSIFQLQVKYETCTLDFEWKTAFTSRTWKWVVLYLCMGLLWTREGTLPWQVSICIAFNKLKTDPTIFYRGSCQSGKSLTYMDYMSWTHFAIVLTKDIWGFNQYFSFEWLFSFFRNWFTCVMLYKPCHEYVDTFSVIKRDILITFFTVPWLTNVMIQKMPILGKFIIKSIPSSSSNYHFSINR